MPSGMGASSGVDGSSKRFYEVEDKREDRSVADVTYLRFDISMNQVSITKKFHSLR